MKIKVLERQKYVDELGSKNKNRNTDVIIFEQLSVQHCQVLITLGSTFFA